MSVLLLYKNTSYPLADTADVGRAIEEQNPKPSPKRGINWLLLLLYCMCAVVGCAAPFFQRLYYNHGGTLKWLQSCLQGIGCILLLPLLLVLYFVKKLPPNVFFMDLRLFLPCVVIGIMYGFANYMYSAGLSYLPISTSALLFSTQLAFVAVFASVLVKQKFTFYSINSILLIILAAIVLGLHTSSDRPAGVTKGKYWMGFFFSLGGAAVGGLTSPLIELAYSRTRRVVTYIILLQVLGVINLCGSFVSIVGMIVQKEFQEIPKEAKKFGVGETKYYLIMVGGAIFWQLSNLGVFGIIKYSSALFAGVFSSALLPFNELFSVIIFHDKFTADKGISLVLSLLGFTSYFTGEYKKDRALAGALSKDGLPTNENNDLRIERNSTFA